MSFLAGRATNEPNNYFAFGKQTTKDTDAATFFFTKHLDGSGWEQDSNVEAIREGGDGQEVSLRYRTMVKGDGALVTLNRQSVAARLWHGVLGTDSIASAQIGSLARHTAVPAATLPYYTVEQAHGDNLERQGNAQWTELTLEGEAGKPWRLTANFMGAGTMTFRDIASALTPTRETGKPCFYPGGSYVFDGAGTYSTDVTKFRVAVTRGVDDNIQTTSLNRDDLVAQNFDVNVDATLKYTNKIFYLKAQSGGGSAIPQNLATGSLNLVQYAACGTLGASCLAQVQVPVLEWTDAKVNKLDPDGKTVYLDVVGQSIKNSTYAIFANHDNTDLAAY